MIKNYKLMKIVALLFLSLQLKSQCTFTSSVPYIENFQGITNNNQIPNCWAASNLGTTCLTFTAANSYAAFFHTPAATSYFYTNGIQLYAGVTYSAGVYYKTNNSGSQNWTDFSLLLGTSQSAVGQSTIASTNNLALASNYTLLSNTFSVVSSGIYYLAIRGVGTPSATSQYLSFDDLFITTPCSLPMNTPTVAISPNPLNVCTSSSAPAIIVTASGASSFTWTSGNNTSTISITPSPTLTSSNLIVYGTNTMTGCSSSKTLTMTVNSTPVTNILASSSSICAGKSTTLSATGAATYSWDNGATTSSIAVNPSANTIYTLVGTSLNGCSSSKTLEIIVNPLPPITASSSNYTLCAGETVTLAAFGAVNYTWSSTSGTISLNQEAIISPTISESYTALGSNANTCINSATINLSVSLCTGINSVTNWKSKAKIFPNPNNGIFSLEVDENSPSFISIMDVTGRVVFSKYLEFGEQTSKVDISDTSNGFYFIKILNDANQQIVKFIKE